jgi:hypothetical protein
MAIEMTEMADRLAEIRTEFDKLLTILQGVEPAMLRRSAELRVLQDLRDITKSIKQLH